MFNLPQNGTNNAQGSPANVPARRYQDDDVIIPVRQPGRPASMREAIPGINCPGEGETWADLHAFRARWGLPPVAQQ